MSTPPRRRFGLALAGLVALAVVLRLVLVAELRDTPLLALHEWRESDMHFFDAWARHLAAGDWLQRTPLHPFLDWHRELVEAYLAAHPGAAAGLADPVADVYARWAGGPVFHQEPLYAYLVAATYALGGAPHWVFAWQLAAGVATVWCAGLVARRAFGATAGILAAALVALCGALAYYELTLLREPLIAFAGVALVLLVDRARERPTLARWLAVGAGLGTALLLKTTFALFGALVAAGLLLGHRRRPGRLAAALGGVALGTALVLAPALARNLAVGAPPLALSSVGTLVFTLVNVPDYPHGAGFAVLPLAGVVMGESDGRAGDAARRLLAAYPDASSVLRTLAVKLDVMGHGFEIANNTNVYHWQLWAPVLRAMPVDFRLLTPLGLVGLALALPRWRRCWPLLAMVGCQAAPLVVFYTLGRLRAPLVPVLAPFAALTVVVLVRAVRARAWGRTAAMAAALAGLALWAGRPLPANPPRVTLTDHLVPIKVWLEPRVAAATGAGDFARAAALLAVALRPEPPALHTAEPPLTGTDATLALVYARLHAARAAMLERAGDAEGARAEQERAEALAARAPEA